MKKNMIGMGIILGILLVMVGMAWLVQLIPWKFLLSQWPGFLIGIVTSLLGMFIGTFIGRKSNDDE